MRGIEWMMKYVRDTFHIGMGEQEIQRDGNGNGSEIFTCSDIYPMNGSLYLESAAVLKFRGVGGLRKKGRGREKRRDLQSSTRALLPYPYHYHDDHSFHDLTGNPLVSIPRLLPSLSKTRVSGFTYKYKYSIARCFFCFFCSSSSFLPRKDGRNRIASHYLPRYLLDSFMRYIST